MNLNNIVSKINKEINSFNYHFKKPQADKNSKFLEGYISGLEYSRDLIIEKIEAKKGV